MSNQGSKDEEMVLVIRRQLFDELGSFQGLNFDVGRYMSPILARENNFFMPRGEAEKNPEFKQIIPYVLLVHEGKILFYVRGKKSGESRLTNKGSIGIGGHLNDKDENLFSYDQTAYMTGVSREVNEELILQTGYQNHIRALLNDDSNEVGKVHLGIVHVFELENNSVARRESAITQMKFLSIAQLQERHDNLETWSQLCIANIGELLNLSAVV